MDSNLRPTGGLSIFHGFEADSDSDSDTDTDTDTVNCQLSNLHIDNVKSLTLISVMPYDLVMGSRHCSITVCAGNYQSLSNFIQLRLRHLSTALMTLPRRAAARSELTARGRPAATHVHQLVAAVMVDSMKPHDDVGTSPYAAGSPDNIMGSNLPDNITDSNLLDQATTGGLPLDELITGSKPHTIMTSGRNLLTTTIMPGHKVLGYDLPNGTTVCSNLHDGVIAGITLQYVTAASSSELDVSPLDGSPLNGMIASGIANLPAGGPPSHPRGRHLSDVMSADNILSLVAASDRTHSAYSFSPLRGGPGRRMLDSKISINCGQARRCGNTRHTTLRMPRGWCATRLKCTYIWATPITERQRKYHAEHGNTASRLVKKIDTTGLPKLATDAQGPESFLSFSIDLRGYCEALGITAYVMGPAPRPIAALGAHPTDEQRAEHAERTQERADKLAEGLRYVCAAIENTNIRADVASNAASEGPTGFAYLETTFLQGLAKQPALQSIVDSLYLKPGASIVAFRAQFSKFANALDPRPAHAILCAKYTKAVTQNTNGFFESCVDVASANPGTGDFTAYATMLTRLCTQKQEREKVREAIEDATNGIKAMNASSEGPSEGGGNDKRIQDLESMFEKLSTKLETFLDQNKQPEKTPQGKGADQRDKRCHRCGRNGHTIAECRQPKQECSFTFGNGEKCGKDHLREFCWYEDPSRCRDPKIRSIIERTIKNKSVDSTPGHSATLQFTEYNDDGYFHCVEIIDPNDKTDEYTH